MKTPIQDFRSWFNGFSSSRTREYFYPNSPILGTLFTLRPWFLFICFETCIIFFLVFPSFATGLASFTMAYGSRAGENVGFMHRANWGPTYLTILPVVFSLAALASRSFMLGVLELLAPPPVIIRTAGNSYKDYLDDFQVDAALRTKYLVLFCLILTIAFTIRDQWHNLNGYTTVVFHIRTFTTWDEFDWMNASQVPLILGPSHHISLTANLAFYALAISSQAIIIFLALFWIGTFWIQSQIFANLMLKNPNYHFQPWEKDPDKRLGLKPIGFVYSTFLSVAILVQGFVYLHRVDLIRNPSIFVYFKSVFSVYTTSFDPKHVFSSLLATLRLLWPLNYFDRLNPGMVLLEIMGPILSVTIAWWPIVRLGRYVNERRKALLSRLRIEALAVGDGIEPAAARDLRERIDGLEKACVWPNGYAVGWGAFATLTVLTVSACLPTLLPVLAVSGLIVKGGKWILSK